MRWRMQPKGEMRLDCLESSRSMLPKHVKWIVCFHAFSIGSTFWINVEIHFIGIHLEWILHSPNIDVTVCLPNLCHLTAKSPDGPHWWPVPTDTLFSKGWMPSNRGIEAMKQNKQTMMRKKSKNGVKQKKWNYLAKILSVFASPPKRSKALAWVAGMTLAGNTRVLAMFVLFQVYVSCPKGQASQVACSWTQPSLLCNRGSIRFNVDTSYVLDIPPVMASDLNATELSGIGRQEWTISQEDLRETKILNRARSIFTLMKKYEYL